MLSQFRNLIKKAFHSASSPDSEKNPVGQASYLGKTSGYRQILPYGYSASPPVGTQLVLFNFLGAEQDLGGIPYGTGNRFKNLKPGEVMLGNPIKNTSIKFDELGNITIETSENDVIIKSAKKVTIEAVDDIDITSSEAKVNIQGATEVNIISDADITITAANEINITADADINLTSTAELTITSTDTLTIKSFDILALEGSSVEIVGDTDITGSLTVSGNITDGTGKTMSAIITGYNAHTHISANPGDPTSTTSNPI